MKSSISYFSMRGQGRIKSSPRVRSGKQYRAEHAPPLQRDFNLARDCPEIFRKNPGPHHRHVLHIRHVREFLSILPQWHQLSVGLNTILLSPHREGCDGFHRPGLVALCAQPRSLEVLVTNEQYVADHASLLTRLEVRMDKRPEGTVIRYTEASLRAFQLMHVLLHELGHHHDRMTTKSRKHASRGEGFAETYATIHGELVWDRYHELASSW